MLLSIKYAELRIMLKKASKSVCTSTVVVSPDTLSPIPSTSSAMKSQDNTKEEHDDPTLAD